jgi:hypothetical protein
MAKMIKPSHVEMPLHLGSFPRTMPVYGLSHPFLGNNDPKIHWEKRINVLKSVFGVSGQMSDAGDRFVLQDEALIRVLQMYKANDSFLYYDRSLVSSTDPKHAKSIRSAASAKHHAETWLAENNLLDPGACFEGTAYTRVSTFQNDKILDPYGDKSYDTEIKACFGFQLQGFPVLGPGAKIMVSYVGDIISQVVYFWRGPDFNMAGEQKIMPPEDIKKHLAGDPRFAHLESNSSKIRITELKLGYYALPPFEVQEFYFPVYQLKGIVETRFAHNGQGLVLNQEKKGSTISETLQYNFNYYLPAGQMTAEAYKKSGFPHPIKGSFLF